MAAAVSGVTVAALVVVVVSAAADEVASAAVVTWVERWQATSQQCTDPQSAI